MFLTLAEELDKMPKTRNNYIGCINSFCLICIKKNKKKIKITKCYCIYHCSFKKLRLWQAYRRNKLKKASLPF